MLHGTCGTEEYYIGYHTGLNELAFSICIHPID